MKKYIIAVIIFFSGCGFNAPFTMKMEVPNGPPEFQAGWHDGCSSGLNSSSFQNARFHKLDLGSGIYQHDPIYQLAYGKAMFQCAAQSGYFRGNPFFVAPLE